MDSCSFSLFQFYLNRATFTVCESPVCVMDPVDADKMYRPNA